ncbi:MAG: hypothetical protein V4467_02700 [Patescibacteria group bacterium]
MSERTPVTETTPAKAETSEMDWKIIRLKEVLGNESVETTSTPEELTSEEALIFRGAYERIISDPKRFLDGGNHALVFETEDGSPYCIKCVWDQLLVNQKSKKYDRLPPPAKKLRAVEEYFDGIKAKKRQFVSKGFAFTPQNRPVYEATITHAAHLIASRAGLKDFVPNITSVVQMKHEETGEEGTPDMYMVTEKLSLLLMDKIKGSNLEKIILNEPDTLRRIDVGAAEKTLRNGLDILHKEGIYHGDLSLRNIMFDYETLSPHIIDFGTGTYNGTPDETAKATDLKQLEDIIDTLRKGNQDPAKARVDLQKRIT